jgi:phage major head subunit gpT-like protein
MSTMNRALFKKQLQEGLNTVFGLEYRRHPEQWRELFEVVNSRKAYEEDVLMVGLGGAQVKAEGAGVAYDSGYEAWTARYIHETVALGFAITEEAVEDNLYGNLGSKFSKSMARSFQHTKEVKGANIFNNGFSASYPMGDGKALFATDHPLAGGGTAANTFSTQADLAEASLEDAAIIIGDMKDDRGIPLALSIRKLVVPTALRFTAERLMMTQLRPGTNDNDVNAMRSRGEIGSYTINQRLTDTSAWFFLTDCPDGFKHFVRVGMKKGMEGDFETGNARYKGRERYSFGVTDWRAGFGSSGNA